jgi:ribosomal protein L12E/L44/L45/RPP1/RPP2
MFSQMRTVAAFLLCVLGGNATPSADDVSKVITAVGGEADADAISKLLKDMEGKVECLFIVYSATHGVSCTSNVQS